MILLVDMDAFFASVEQAHHPHLRGQPVIVCGDPSRRGVVTAASYEARPRGVHAGMPLGEARALCPEAHYVEGNPEKYVSTSLELLERYTRITPDVEPFSVDEAFLMLNPRVTMEEAVTIAATLQRDIDREFRLGASIGIGPNKLVAKMAAGARKPRGLTAFDVLAFQAFFWPKDVQELWGVGPKLARAPSSLLEGEFGIIGPQLRDAASGLDDTPLTPYWQGVDPKSMGHEVTLPRDCCDPAAIEGTLLRLSDQVARRLRGDGWTGKVVALKLRDHRFTTRMRQRALRAHTDRTGVIFETARTLWRELWNGEPVRLIGVTVADLAKAPAQVEQAELFTADTRKLALRDAVDRMRDKLGEASVVPAASLAHRRGLGHVPFGAVSPRTPRGRAGGGTRGA
jgi:DNA polymerase-4